MKTKETKKNIIQAGQVAVEELIKVAKEPIVDSDDDISADRLKNAAATKKLAIFDAFEILNRIQEEQDMLDEKPKEIKFSETKGPHLVRCVNRLDVSCAFQFVSDLISLKCFAANSPHCICTALCEVLALHSFALLSETW